MRKVIVIKTGSTLPALIPAKGDFEDWVLRGMGADGNVAVVDAQDGVPLPAYNDIAGVVITGSHDMVTDRLPWSERLAAWLPGLIERAIPTLGICYGHQLLAHALGGEVGDNPTGREYGTVPIRLLEEVRSDRLLGGLPDPIEAHVSHTQSVLRLPAGARRLAYSDRDACAAFAVGDAAWGVQFHPEFDAEVMAAYIEHSAAHLRGEGQDPARLAAGVHDTPFGSEILQRFLEIAISNEPLEVIR